jgi:hypothetical protein
MIHDISSFNKNSSPSEIRDFLEKRYNTKIDYMTVYNNFRKLFPRFGPEDCQSFIGELEKNNAKYKFIKDKEERYLTKLIFVTPLMQDNYSRFHDVVLIDTTYNINYLSVPLVVISGVDSKYRNILFALALINEETSITYQWVLTEFLNIMNSKKPKLIISDMDTGLNSAISIELADSTHRLCSWHVARNLGRNLGFLEQSQVQIKTKIRRLPFISYKEKFDSDLKDVMDYLKKNKFEKSIAYLEKLCLTKEKWAKAYHVRTFDCAINTTSRVESWNSTIKKYLNSKSEFVDLITFIKETETHTNFYSPKYKNTVYAILEKDILLQKIKELVAPMIYDKVIWQYVLSRNPYTKKELKPQNSEKLFQIFLEEKKETSNDESDIEKVEGESLYKPLRKYMVSVGEKITCDCGLFETCGLICRHIFFICSNLSIRDTKFLQISNRWIKTLNFHLCILMKIVIIYPK